jgi:hypothetical protein
MLSTASEVWAFLKRNGGINLDSYDKELPTELFQSLRFSSSSPTAIDLETLLKANAVPVEEFLVAFFKVVQPFADMMVDLLRLFEEAKASQGKLNLAVRFDFDKDLPALEFDLDHFRRWQEIWQRVAGKFLVNLWNSNSLWQLNGMLRSVNAKVRDPQMQRWLAIYSDGKNGRGHWSDVEPPAPKSGNSELDATLERVWRVWLTVVRECKRYGADRERLNRLCFGPDRIRSADLESEAGQQREAWPIELLGGLDSDLWPASLAQGAYAKAEAISDLPEPERSAEAQALNQKLTELFASLQVMEVEGESLQRTLQDFLSLPIWQRRHELYSAWISTQILNALCDHDVEIHCVAGQLLFEFRGTHLATIGTFRPNLHLMAELRSPLVAPRGVGRKRAMQPDYSLITSPITSPECSVLEVECKQYLVASKRKFADALTDYANGRPNAQIVLVNYGPASNDILDEVDASVRSRTHVIGLMRPRSEPSQSDFADLVKNAVLNRFATTPTRNPISLLSQTQHGQLAGQIVLSWESLPKDLDLHLNILQRDQVSEVNFSSMGSISGNPWARLDQDIRNGRGPETIQIAQWLDGTYHCGVLNYSNDYSLAGCGAKLAVMLGKQELVIECPTSGVGVWWDAFSYSPNTRKLEIFNRITSSFP